MFRKVISLLIGCFSVTLPHTGNIAGAVGLVHRAEILLCDLVTPLCLELGHDNKFTV